MAFAGLGCRSGIAVDSGSNRHFREAEACLEFGTAFAHRGKPLAHANLRTRPAAGFYGPSTPGRPHRSGIPMLEVSTNLGSTRMMHAPRPSMARDMAAQAAQKILCIEDDYETAALIREEFGERGFTVVVAHDGEEGLAAIEREWPDLVLCDICMPGISGLEVLRRLRVRLSPVNRMPFVLMTAWSDRDIESEGRRLGADDYVIKPIDFDALAAIITARSAERVRQQPAYRSIRESDRRTAAAIPAVGSMAVSS